MNKKSNPEDPSWISEKRGEARAAFESSKQAKPAVKKPAGEGSEMVKNAQFSLSEGPIPPGVARAAVNRQSFNRRWREEGRGFRAQRFLLMEEFNRKAGTIRNTVVHSETGSNTRLVKRDFNHAAQVRRRGR